MLDQYQRQHRFCDRRGTDADAGIVPAMSFHHHRLTQFINRVAWNTNAGSGFDRNVRNNILPCGNTTENTTGMVG